MKQWARPPGPYDHRLEGVATAQGPSHEPLKGSISALTDVDEPLFDRLLAGSHRFLFPLSYEGSFAFFSHRAGFFPMKFYDGRMLAVFYARESAYSVLRPLGEWSPQTVLKLAQYLFDISRHEVRFEKLTHTQHSDLVAVRGFTPTTETLNLAQMGDDRYPQLVIPVRVLLGSLADTASVSAGAFSSFSYLRRILRVFERGYGDSFVLYPFREHHLLDVERVIEQWKADFLSRYRRDRFATAGDDRADLSLPADDEFLTRPYQCLLHRFCKKVDMRKHHGFVAYLKGEPVGFSFLSRTSPSCAALYANLAITQYRGLAYYLLYSTIKELTARHIDYINLGGQETNSLTRFYSRFNPFPLKEPGARCYELLYDGQP